MSIYIEMDAEIRMMSESQRESQDAAADASSHVACWTCDLRVCLVGEQGLTDDCRDDELGLRVGKDEQHAVHLGPCKVAYHAWVEDSKDAVERAAAAFRPFKGSLLTKTVAGYVSALVWLEWPRLTRADVESLCFPESNLIRGKLITEEMVLDRARQIASVILAG